SDFERFRAIRPKGMTCIDNGVNTSKFSDASARRFQKSILWIGRFAKNKRLDLLIAFAQALFLRDPEWKFTIAGQPGDLTVNDIRTLVKAVRRSDAITVVTSPSDATLKSLMGNSSFIASSSEYEGFGLTAVEGMSAGLFPLLSDIPPFRRLIARTGLGMVIDYSQPDAAARHVLENVTGIVPEYAERRRACMQAAMTFDWQHVARQYAALYSAATGMTTRTLLDVPIQVRTYDEAIELLDAQYEAGEPVAVAFANAHTLNV